MLARGFEFAEGMCSDSEREYLFSDRDLRGFTNGLQKQRVSTLLLIFHGSRYRSAVIQKTTFWLYLSIIRNTDIRLTVNRRNSQIA